MKMKLLIYMYEAYHIFSTLNIRIETVKQGDVYKFYFYD